MTTKLVRDLLWATAAGVVLMAAAGCPSSAGKSGAAKPKPSASAKPPTDELAATSKLPAAEFQHPAPVPPSEPLPKPTQEAIDRPATPSAEPAQPAPDANVAAPGDAVTMKAGENAQPPAGRPNIAKNSGKPFDPVEENGPIFVVEQGGQTSLWPKPKLAAIITGMEEGYIEPCGCAGLDRMKGGMSRRHTLFQELRRKGWPVVGLDVGGLVHGFGPQADQKFQTLVEGKRMMGYNAIAFGPDDLRLPAALLASVAGESGPFISSNVGLFSFDAGFLPTSRLIEAGGMKIGVTAVLGKQYQKEARSEEIVVTDPEAALQKVLSELKKSKPDCLVLLAQATMEESVALAKKFPEFGVVVTSDGYPVPPKYPQTIEGLKTLLITVGQKGMYAVVLGFVDDAENPVLYQRVPLDSRFAASADMKMLMAGYQDWLKDQLTATGVAGLGLRPMDHPLAEENGKFVGSEKCQSCHEKSYDIWKKSRHAHAYDTLAKLDPPRNFDPECVSCHVTGWHPTKFFPYTTGYQSKEKNPLLINAGCENCHGPGEKHCAVELSGSEELKLKYRKAAVVTKAESEKQQCMTCHDGDNSPDFKFELYWPFVEHYEKE